MLGPKTTRWLEESGSAVYWDRAVAAGLRAPGAVPMYWYRHQTNVGDVLAPEIMRRVFGVRPVWVSRRYAGKLLSTGSVVQDIAPNDVVWGSGLIVERMTPCPDGARILAVRGPLTRSCIAADVPEIYGDPACLVPMFHNRPVERRFEIGIVPHYVDAPFLTIDDPAVTVVDVLQPWRKVVDHIRSCDAIVSSSLHGLVLAEAYGIPAAWMAMGDRLVGGTFKFRDYYLGSGRDIQEPVHWGAGLAAAVDRLAPPAQFDTDALVRAWTAAAPLEFRAVTRARQEAIPEPVRSSRGSHVVVLVGGATESDADIDARVDATVIDLGSASLEALQDHAESVHEHVTVVAATWSDVSKALVPARLLGQTAELLLVVADGGARFRRRPDLSVFPDGEISLQWSPAVRERAVVRCRIRRPLPVATFLQALTGPGSGPLKVPIRVGLADRGAEAFAAGNPLARYVGIDDAVVTRQQEISSVDLVLESSANLESVGSAEPLVDGGLPRVRVLPLDATWAETDVGGYDPTVVLPPVDVTAINPMGYVQGADKPPLRTARGPGGTVQFLTPQERVVGELADFGALPFRLLKRLRSARYVEATEDAHAGPTPYAHLLLQLSAAGVPVAVERISPAVRSLLSGSVCDVLGETKPALLDEPLLRDAVSVALRRAALRDHGPGAHARRLLALGGQSTLPLPLISVLLVSRRPSFLKPALQQVAQQTWGPLEVVLGLHGDHFTRAVVDDAVADFPHPVTVVSVEGDCSFGEALNRATSAANGRYVTKWDDDDYYGSEHLWDLMLALDYSGATLVGKGPEFVYLESINTITRRTIQRPERRTTWIAGGTLLLSRTTLHELGGWRPVPFSVDQALVRQIVDDGGSVYRTQGMGYVLRRHGQGHTWDPGTAYFLDAEHPQWRCDPDVLQVILENDLSAGARRFGELATLPRHAPDD